MTQKTDNKLAPQFRRCPLFRDLDDVECADLALGARLRSFGKGEFVFQKGDQPTHLYFVSEGLIKEACQSLEGGEKIVEILESGDAFGEAAIFLDTPYPFSAMAIGAASVVAIDKQVVLALVCRHPEFVQRMLQSLSHRMYGLVRDIESYSLHTPTQRVAYYLLSRCCRRNSPKETIVLPATKAAIASRLGMTPEALSRILRDFADARLIAVERNRIDLLDIERLKTFA
jgi:CRP-like cAMP-binding protein